MPEQAKQTIINLENYFKQIKMPTRLSDLNLGEIDIQRMALALSKNKTNLS